MTGVRHRPDDLEIYYAEEQTPEVVRHRPDDLEINEGFVESVLGVRHRPDDLEKLQTCMAAKS